MRYEINWGYSVKVDKDSEIEKLKFYFGDTFSKKCKNEEYSEDNLFEIDVCGKIWANLNSEEDFLKNGKILAKKTAQFVKQNMELHGHNFLYSNILRKNIAEIGGFAKENGILDLSVDKMVKCYKKIAGKIVAKDIMFVYNKVGFEETEINPAINPAIDNIYNK